jgi:hypothetical protein
LKYNHFNGFLLARLRRFERPITRLGVGKAQYPAIYHDVIQCRKVLYYIGIRTYHLSSDILLNRIVLLRNPRVISRNISTDVGE